MSPNVNTALSFSLGLIVGVVATAIHYGKKFVDESSKRTKSKVIDMHPDIDQSITESIRYEWREKCN